MRKAFLFLSFSVGQNFHPELVKNFIKGSAYLLVDEPGVRLGGLAPEPIIL